MKALLIRIFSIVAGFTIVFMIAQFLQVPAWPIASLAAWGLSCMLFSYELGGRRHVFRQGFEERNWFERAWLFAGAGCLLGAFVLTVIYF